MPFSLEATRWGYKKEAVRLTAETTPTSWFGVDPGSEINHRLVLLEDKGLRGVKATFPSKAGMLITDGKIAMPLRTAFIGAFLQMILGNASTAATAEATAYKHTFVLPTSTQPPTYTFFVDRSLGVKKYNGCAVKKLSMKSGADGFIQVDTDIIGLTEAAGSIGSPSYAAETIPLTYQHGIVKLGGVTMTNIKEWALSIDTGLFAKRNPGSQVASDVIAPGQMKIEGNMTIYFENETERAEFLVATKNALEFLITGDVIGTGVSEALNITIPKIAYKAFPYGEVDGMLGAQVVFEAEYDTATSKLVTVDLTNMVATYI